MDSIKEMPQKFFNKSLMKKGSEFVIHVAGILGYEQSDN